MASIMLGIMIYTAIAGPDEDSMMSSVRELWEKEIDLRSGKP
jgi:hypothetical protein